nr:hypothetical protein [Tanacetum cinerariifolium]
MDSDSANMMAATKVLMLKPENGLTLPKTQVMESVTTLMPITSVEDKAQRRLEVKARSTLMMGIPNEHQLKFNSIKDAKQLMEAIEKRFVNTAQAVNTVLGVSTASTQVNTINIDNLSDAVICAFLSSQPSSSQLVNEDLEQIDPDDSKEMDLRWQMAMLTMRARRFLKKTKRKLTVNGNETIGFDKTNMECYSCHKRRHFSRECRAPRSHDTKHNKSTKSIYLWKHLLQQLWYHVMVLVVMIGVTKLKKNEQLLKDLKKSKLMVLGYKSGLEFVEERLKFFKTNEYVYLEDIKLLKVEIQMKYIAIKELIRKLKVAQKEKEGIQLTVEKLKNASKSLNKLIDCQIVDNCKKELGYESYNAVPPPYTGNFIPPKPDLSYIGLDEFAVKPIVENKYNEEETKAGNSKMDLQDKGVIDSGCSRNMTWNMSYLTDYKEVDGGYLAFGGNPKRRRITGKGKFNGKADEGFFVGYSMNSKAFRVFNSRKKIVEENLHIRFSEKKELRELGKTVAGEVQLQALVDGKKVIITESTVRKDLQLEDAEGVTCLPNPAIFEQLTLIGTMASAIIFLAANQKFNFSKYIFESMVKNLDNVNKFLMYPRKTKRKETELPLTSGPTTNIADEAIN